MGKDPSFPFYASDWLGSTKRAMMTPAERGAYIDLLAHQWGDATCSLEDDDDLLSVLSGLGEGWFPDGSRMLRRCFPKHPTLEGRIANPRLLELRAERDAWIEKSRAGGKKSGEARRLKNRKAIVLEQLELTWRDGTPRNGESCVYLLLENDRPTYVGQTQDLTKRLGQHRTDEKAFDSVVWASVAFDQMVPVEEAIISRMNSDPRYDPREPNANHRTNQRATKGQPKGNTPSPSPSPSPSSSSSSTPPSSPSPSPSPEKKVSAAQKPCRPTADESDQEGYTAGFKDWWSHYPRKKAKRKAFAEFKRAKKRVSVEKLTTAVQAFARSVIGTDPKYIVHPDKWLRDGRYDDQATSLGPVLSDKEQRTLAAGDRFEERMRANEGED